MNHFHDIPSHDVPSPAGRSTAALIARLVEARLHDTLPDAVPDPFRLPRCRLLGVAIVDPDRLLACDDSALRLDFLGDARNVYDLLDSAAGSIARLYDAAVLVTTGWAAPFDPDGRLTGRPSNHPQRRRIRLVVAVDDDGVSSVLRFADDPDHPVDPGAGEGMLAESLADLWTLGPRPSAPRSLRPTGTEGRHRHRRP
jgi:hypothetical protein